MNELQQKQAAFLKETIEHFHLGNRAVDEHEKCSYAQGCAIGRKLSPDLCAKLDNHDFDPTTTISALTHYYDEMPQDIQVLGGYFLFDVQRIHDSRINWNSNGLSVIGRGAVERLMASYNLTFESSQLQHP